MMPTTSDKQSVRILIRMVRTCSIQGRPGPCRRRTAPGRCDNVPVITGSMPHRPGWLQLVRGPLRGLWGVWGWWCNQEAVR